MPENSPEDLELPMSKIEGKKADALKGIERTGLDFDCYNNWASLFYISEIGPETEITLPAHYEEYVRKSNTEKEVADFILERSDPTAVAGHDRLVDEFHSSIDDIRKTGNIQALKVFHDRANKLIRGE